MTSPWAESDILTAMYVMVALALISVALYVKLYAPALPQKHNGTESSQQNKSSFKAIPDQFQNVDDVRKALRKAGLESSELVVAIDFTKSNMWTGEKSFGGKCLHALDEAEMNPYQQGKIDTERGGRSSRISLLRTLSLSLPLTLSYSYVFSFTYTAVLRSLPLPISAVISGSNTRGHGRGRGDPKLWLWGR